MARKTTCTSGGNKRSTIEMHNITPADKPKQNEMCEDDALVLTKAVKRPPSPVARPAIIDIKRGFCHSIGCSPRSRSSGFLNFRYHCVLSKSCPWKYVIS